MAPALVDTTGSTDDARVLRVSLERVCCRKCRALLCKLSERGVRQGGMLEIKCGSCNTLNYVVGMPDVDA